MELQKPTLQVGSHLTPQDGACLMELVAVSAGEEWSDHPPCTQPLLGYVARRVNDASSDRERTDLAAFVAVLATANSSDPLVFARIAAACTELALKRRATLMVRILHRAASRRLHSSTPGPRRFSGHLYAHGTAYRSVDFAVLAVRRLPPPEADDALRAMLTRATQAITQPAAVPAHRPETREPPATDCGDSRDPGCRGRALTERTQPTQRGPETPASVTVSGACGV